MGIKTRFRDYQGRQILVTGHTGFKGSWLSAWLIELGANVFGIALPPPGMPNLFVALDLEHRLTSKFLDIRDRVAVSELFTSINPEIVFHLAAQPLVRPSYAMPLETFETNIIGTANVLEACRTAANRPAVVCVTTDKVYENRDWAWPYREIDRLGGRDPYSASKTCAEIVASVYRNAFDQRTSGLKIATARGGNVVGGGDWSQDRIVPDIVRAVETGAPIRLRHPNAVRPWQHVLELSEGYLELGLRLLEDGNDVSEAWNFGPWPTSQITVAELVRIMLDVWCRPDYPVESESSPVHEAHQLRLDISKAVTRLSWRPRLNIRETLTWTGNWYRDWLVRTPWDLTLEQIKAFEALDAPACVCA